MRSNQYFLVYQLTKHWNFSKDGSMIQNIFQFNGKFYRQNESTTMGNSLSGFLAEIFMSFFEMDLMDRPLFPWVGFRYVDDIFSISFCIKIDTTLKMINNWCTSIQFTCEREVDNKIQFLDVMIYRVNNKLDFSIYL